MPEFSDRELFIAQIAGVVAAIISIIMGITGSIMLANDTIEGLAGEILPANNGGVPEYDLCLRNTGWTLLLVSLIWLGLASWHRHLRK